MKEKIFLSTGKNNCNFWQVRYFKWRRFLSSTLFFFTVNWTQTADLVTALIPLSSLYGISCRFEFHNLWRAWNRQHWLYNLALFSIYGNDGTTISTEVNPCRKLKLRTMILFISNSVLFFSQKFVISTFESLVLFIFVLFQPHRNKEVKSGYSIYIMEWNSNSSYPCIKYITLYPQRFNVLWCPTLVLLSQTCFLLLLSGGYGYDRNCWFQAKMNINIRNELLSPCLGSLYQKLDS